QKQRKPNVTGRAACVVLRFDRFAAVAMTAFTRHVCAAGHPMPWWLWYFSASWQAQGEDGRSNDQDKAARQRRDHDVEVNTVVMRINADAGCTFGENEFVRKSGG